MKYRNLWIIGILLIAGLPLTGCGSPPKTVASHANPPAGITPIAGGDLHYVVLSEQAINRLKIQTAPVREEQVTRKRSVGGAVSLPDAGPPNTTTKPAPGGVWVRVPLPAADLRKVDRGQLVRVLPLDGTGAGVPGQPVETQAAAPQAATGELYYVVNSAGHGLAAGQRVHVELTLAGSTAPRKLIPYAAVVYDTHGDTWAYTSSEPRTFVRHRVVVDYIEGDRAVLSEGPPTGTAVVTVGGAELLGTEFGVGH
jgi:hypothetical protein